MPVRDVETFWPVRADPPRVLCNRGANGIDGTVSSAFGAAAAEHGPVVLLIGDVALAHDIGGLLAAKRLGLKLTIVLLDNEGGGIFDFLPVAHAASAGEIEPRTVGGETTGAGDGHDDIYTRHIATPTGLDFAQAAALYGLEHETVADVASFRAALERALAAPRSTMSRCAPSARRTSSCTGACGAPWRALSAGEPQPVSSGSRRRQLDLRLPQLGDGNGVAHDAVAGVAAGDVAAQKGAAQRNAELAVAGRVSPADGAGVPAAVETLQRRDQPERWSGRLAAHGRRRVHEACQFDRLHGRGELRSDRGREVLDVGDPHERRLGRGGDPDRVAVEGALDAAHDDRVLLAVAVVAHQALAEVRVDRGVGAATGGAGERDRADALALTPHEQLGEAATSVASPRPTQNTKQEGKASRNTPNTAAGSYPLGACTCTSRASTIF